MERLEGNNKQKQMIIGIIEDKKNNGNVYVRDDGKEATLKSQVSLIILILFPIIHLS